MKRYSRTTKIGDLINSFYEDNRLVKNNSDETLIDIWREVIGMYIFSKTKKIFFRKNNIYIEVEDKIIKNELLAQLPSIKDNLSDKIKNIKDIILI
tara:strand:+ start:510 stop:797 length:288 start_codon:yes stop_codon:yes gene_type:complete